MHNCFPRMKNVPKEYTATSENSFDVHGHAQKRAFVKSEMKENWFVFWYNYRKIALNDVFNINFIFSKRK